MDSSQVIKYPLSTEKSIRLLESDNKLVFIVDIQATKSDVKRAIEELFKVKVAKVNTFITAQGQKKAYVRLFPDSPALDVATELGLM